MTGIVEKNYESLPKITNLIISTQSNQQQEQLTNFNYNDDRKRTKKRIKLHTARIS